MRNAFSDVFVSFLLARNARIQEDLVDQLFNSSEKRLARVLLLLAHFGKDSKPESVIPKISQEVLAEMIGTTRSRVNFFMNRFRKLGFIDTTACWKAQFAVETSYFTSRLGERLVNCISSEPKSPQSTVRALRSRPVDATRGIHDRTHALHLRRSIPECANRSISSQVPPLWRTFRTSRRLFDTVRERCWCRCRSCACDRANSASSTFRVSCRRRDRLI